MRLTARGDFEISERLYCNAFERGSGAYRSRPIRQRSFAVWSLLLIQVWRESLAKPATAFGRRVRGRSGFELFGTVDLRTSTRIWGWVWNAADPGERVHVCVRTKSQILAVGIANLYRPDLEQAGIGDGRHAFDLVFPPCAVDKLAVETVDTKQIIPVAPYAIEDAALVHHGEDGWLFQRAKVESFYTQDDYFNRLEIEKWCQILRDRKEQLRALWIPYFHMIAPDKLTVYADRYQAYLPFYNSRPSFVLPLALSEFGCADLYIDLSDPLIAARDEHLLYWKTDTHWTYFGTVLVVQEICRTLGIKEPDFARGTFYERSAALDLGGQCKPRIEEKIAIFQFSKPAELIYANDIVSACADPRRSVRPRLHVGSHVVYRNPDSPNKLRLVLFGDSYCGVGKGTMLTGMLSQTFQEVHFMWSNSIDYGYIAEVKPDVVLSELAERFVKRFPNDGMDLRAFAAKRFEDLMAKFSPEPRPESCSPMQSQDSQLG